MAQRNFMIKNGLRVGDSDLFVTSGGTTVKNLTVGNVSIPSTIGSDDQILKVVSGSLAFASIAEMEDSDLSKVANLQNKVDSLINRLDSDDADRQIGTLVIDSDGQILLNTNDDIANSGTLTIDSDGDILFLTGNDTIDSVGNAILSLRADRDSDSSKLGKINEVINRLDSDSTAIQSLATNTRTDLDSDSIIIQQLKTAVNANTAARTSSSIDDNGDATAITIDSNEDVGIGTSSPAEKLAVNGNMRLQSGNNPARIQYFNSDAAYSLGTSGGASISFHDVSGSQEIAFETHYSGNSHAERARISKEGNVGIGTGSPSTKLEVSGASNSTATFIKPQGALPDNNDNAGLYVLHQGTAGTGLRVRTDNALTGSNFAHILVNNASASINAFQVSQYGSGLIAKFDKSGTTAMQIDNSGHVTMPNQPAFLVRPSSNQLNVATDDVIAFGTEVFDRGADFTSNTFTAPVGGLYNLTVSIRADNLDVGAQFTRIFMDTSNRNYFSIFDVGGLSSDPSHWTLIVSVLADMDANDTVSIKWSQAGGANQADIDTDSYFSGYLVA